MTISATQRPADEPHRTARPPLARESRVEQAFDNARRHSGRVRALKLLLPVAAMLMVVVFVGKSWLSTPAGVSVNLGGTVIEGGRLVMADPRLDGFTSDNRAYTMTAARAIQEIGNAGRIDLEEIDARLPFDEGNWMKVAARSGVYDRDANRLDIDSDMTVVTDTGITAVLKSARVDMTAGSLDTGDPVDITLDGARIEADSMQVSDRGSVLIFENRVRMEIEGGRLKAASAEGETNED